MKMRAIGLAAILVLSACATTIESHPPRTATEELLISAAAERAAMQVALPFPKSAKVFVDASNFEGTDSKNAIAAIRDTLLKEGVALVDDKKTASIIVEIRAGALSMNENTFLFGIPSFPVPVPFASSALNFPEIAFYKSEEQKGIAKFALVGYAAKSRVLLASQEPQYGFSHDTQKTLLFLISWEDSDIMPDGAEDKSNAATKQVDVRSK